MDQERYDVAGERWMPKSLLSIRGGSYRPPRRIDDLTTRRIFASNLSKVRNNVLCERGVNGLKTGLKGLRIDRTTSPDRDPTSLHLAGQVFSRHHSRTRA